jgi:hypothetical protein
MDRRLTPYAAAQRVIAVGGDVPDLWPRPAASG